MRVAIYLPAAPRPPGIAGWETLLAGEHPGRTEVGLLASALLEAGCQARVVFGAPGLTPFHLAGQVDGAAAIVVVVPSSALPEGRLLVRQIRAGTVAPILLAGDHVRLFPKSTMDRLPGATLGLLTADPGLGVEVINRIRLGVDFRGLAGAIWREDGGLVTGPARTRRAPPPVPAWDLLEGAERWAARSLGRPTWMWRARRVVSGQERVRELLLGGGDALVPAEEAARRLLDAGTRGGRFPVAALDRPLEAGADWWSALVRHLGRARGLPPWSCRLGLDGSAANAAPHLIRAGCSSVELDLSPLDGGDLRRWTAASDLIERLTRDRVSIRARVVLGGPGSLPAGHRAVLDLLRRRGLRARVTLWRPDPTIERLDALGMTEDAWVEACRRPDRAIAGSPGWPGATELETALRRSWFWGFGTPLPTVWEQRRLAG